MKNLASFLSRIEERASGLLSSKLFVGTSFFLFFVSFLRVPQICVDETHDRAYVLVFDYCIAHGLKFGQDITANVGPWGPLFYARLYTGLHTAHKFIFAICFALLLTDLVFRVSKAFSQTTTRLGWLLLLSFVPSYIGNPLWAMGESFDHKAPFFITMAACYLFLWTPSAKPKIYDGFVFILLSLLSLMKGTALVSILMLMFLLTVYYLSLKLWTKLGFALAAFSSGFLLFWFGSGQALSNLPLFLGQMFDFAKGYDEALMFADGKEALQMVLALIGLSYPIFLSLRCALRSGRAGYECLPFLLFCAGIEFIMWKHSLVRGGRAPVYWNLAIVSLPIMVASALHSIKTRSLYLGAAEKSPESDFSSFSFGKFSAISLCNLVFGVPVILTYPPVKTCFWNEIPKNLYSLFFMPKSINSMAATLSETRSKLALPNIKRTVGSDTVDEFGREPAWPILNDLNYRPRPNPITFNTFNKPLIDWNGDFYRNGATAPNYLMARFFPLEDRFGAQDDSMAVLEIKRRYVPILIENQHLLLKRVPVSEAPPTFKLLQSQATSFGRAIKVPSSTGQKMWCRVKVKYTLLGRLRAFFCKPGAMFIQLESLKGEIINRRFLACAGDVGFMLNPLIFDTQTLLWSYTPDGDSKLFRTYKMGFFTKPSESKYFEDQIEVTFENVESP
jgi:hypothetical protein